MSIHIEENKSMQKGFVKKLDESGIAMTFDILQKSQYAYPVKSTVREILCNGIDSINEKKMAKEILTGKANVSDYFVSLEGEIYNDSKWSPEYYDLNWLSDYDKVHITYKCGTNMQKDSVIITDHGVGLGGKRLEKYFSLGFSTKRLSRIPLGKFGLGAKAPLSIGEPFYTVESYYNGKLFRFNVYSHKVDSLIPKLNMTTGKENKHIVFDEGTENEYTVYYEDTTEKNKFSVILTAKTHHKPQYIDAVKQQMLYFDEIVFTLVDSNGTQSNIDYKSNILYEDDFIVLADNNYFTAPHLLLNKVNYGFIDWQELELEKKTGNIGIKVAPEDIEVNPSRESVLWTEKTKLMVLQRFNKVVDIATSMVSDELKERDIVRWLKACYQVAGASRWSNGILARLSNIIDLAAIKPTFILDPEIRFRIANPLRGTFMKDIGFAMRTSPETGETKKYIKRTVTDSLSSIVGRQIVLFSREDSTSNRKDKYLLYLYPNGYTAIYEPYKTEEDIKDNAPAEYQKWYDVLPSNATSLTLRENTWIYLCASKEVLFYSKVSVPDTFTGNEDEEETIATAQEEKEEIVEQARQAVQTAAERRKLTGKTVIHLLQNQEKSTAKVPSQFGKGFDVIPANYSFTKIEYPINAINEWQGEEVYYGNDKDSALLHTAAILTRPPGQPLGWIDRLEVPDSTTHPRKSPYEIWTERKWFRLNKDKLHVPPQHAYRLQSFYDSPVKLLKVAESTNRLYRDFNKIEDFFFKIKGNTITMSNLLIKWNTARIIRDKMANCAFLYNFSAFNPSYAEAYNSICKYIDANWRDISTTGELYGLGSTGVDDLLSHLDMVYKFQIFVKQQSGDAAAIAGLADQLFGNRDLKDGMAVEPQIIESVDKLIEYAIAVGDMLNHIPILTGYTTKPHTYPVPGRNTRAMVSNEFEMEVRAYLEYKQVLEWADFDEEEEDLMPFKMVVAPEATEV